MGLCMSNIGIPREKSRCLAPPRSPPPVEEETVKEVLSETRIVPKVDGGGVQGISPARKVEFGQPRRVNHGRKAASGEITSEPSEVLLSCSASLSNTETNEDAVVGKMTPPRRKLRQSPAASRKPAISSPERRKGDPIVPPRAARGRPGQPTKNERGPSPRRDPGERRSRTPVRRAAVNSNATERKSEITARPRNDVVEESLDNPVVSLECFIFL